MKLAGRRDALALGAIASASAAIQPWVIGMPVITGVAAALSAGGAGGLMGERAYRRLRHLSQGNNTEGIVIRSDEPYPVDDLGLHLGLTKDRHRWVGLAQDRVVRHTAIVGRSGSGKTTLIEYMLWQQMNNGGGWCFIDAKIDRETRDRIAALAERLGRDDELLVLNLDDPANSNSYSPILEGDADEVASRLMHLVPASENNPGADHYRQGAYHGLTAIIGAAKASKLRYTMQDLAILMQSGKAIKWLEEVTPEGAEKRSLSIFLDKFRKRNKDGDTMIDVSKLKDVLGGMAGRIALFAQGKFGQVFGTYAPEISMEEVARGRKMLYVMLPTMHKETAALNLAKMILSDLRSATARLQSIPKSERPSPSTLILADEVGAYAMPGLKALFEQARSAGLAMIPGFQSFNQLENVAPGFADEMIQNTEARVFFGFGSKDAPETAAEIIGKQMKWQRSISRSTNEGESAQTLQTVPQSSQSDGGGLSESYREMEEFRVTPDQLRALEKGEAIVTVGPRLYHLLCPMLTLDEEVQPLEVARHKTYIPKDEEPMNLEERLNEFLMMPSDNEAD